MEHGCSECKCVETSVRCSRWQCQAGGCAIDSEGAAASKYIVFSEEIESVYEEEGSRGSGAEHEGEAELQLTSVLEAHMGPLEFQDAQWKEHLERRGASDGRGWGCGGGEGSVPVG